MKWSEIEDKNRFIGLNIMGWQDKPCDLSETGGELTVYDDGNAYCRRCGVSEHINSFDHGMLLVPHYTENIELALQVVEMMQLRHTREAWLSVQLKAHRAERYRVEFYYPVMRVLEGNLSSGYTGVVETRKVQESCNLDKLAETICFVVCKALSLVESEDEE